jgi:glycosyltransferase involved in cell wall biosynthesis
LLFVEPAYDPLHRLATGHVPQVHRSRVQPVAGYDRLWTLQPLKALPRLAGGVADTLLARQVERAVADLGFKDPVLWINDAAYVHLLERHRWPALYDITDDWLAAESTQREHDRRVARERTLLRRAQEVVVCSPVLAETRGATRPVRLIPNGVDVAAYAGALTRPVDLPMGPTAVYVGTLHRDRLDVELVLEAAAALPEVNFVFVGPNALSANDTALLRGAHNVVLLGARASQDVPRYLTHATALIVPHVRNAFTDSLDPIKAYEYLAAARPVAATDVAGFRDRDEPHVRSVPRADFVAALRGALTDTTAKLAPPLPDWSERGREFRDALAAARVAPKPRVKVAFVGHSAQLSGGELALARLAPLLDDVEATVVLAEDGPLVERLRQDGVATEVIPMPPRTQQLRRSAGVPLRAVTDTLRYVGRLRARLRELQPDIVHTNTLKAAIYGTVAARLSRVPVVVHVRDRIAADYLPARTATAVRAFVRAVPTTWIANSAATAQTIGGGRGRVIYDLVIPPSRPREEQRAEIRCVGIVGRLAPWKGQHVFLEAFARTFGGTSTQAHIVGAALFGEDDYVAQLDRAISQLGIGEQVRFIGFVDDVFGALTDIDVLVHASTIPEPFGQVIIEAMAAGVPVIATAGGGPSEIVRDGITGLLVAPDDVTALADALRRVDTEPGLRSQLAAEAAEDVERFFPERIAAQYSDLYGQVLGRDQGLYRLSQ